MKTLTTKRNRAIIGLAIMIALAGAAIPYEANAIEVAFVVGSVKLIRNGKSSTPDVKTQILSGDMIQTGKGSLADIALADGSQIKVMENSSIKFSGDSKDKPDSVSVIAGIIESKFKKLTKGSESRIITPTNICSVRGTEFRVAVSDGADSRIDMTEGALELRNPYGRTTIRNRQQSYIRMGDKPASGRDKLSMEQWKEQRDQELDRDPRDKGSRIKNYLGTMNERTSKTSERLNSLDSSFKDSAPQTARDLKKSEGEINKLDEEVKDDLYMSEATNESLGRMVDRFKKGDGDIRDMFSSLKDECDKVYGQKKKNYEKIQAVKEAYRKAYEEIMGKMNKDRDSIRRSVEEMKGSK